MQKFIENKSFLQSIGLLTAVFGLPVSAVAALISEPKAAMFNFVVGAVGLSIAAIDPSLKNAPKHTHN